MYRLINILMSCLFGLNNSCLVYASTNANEQPLEEQLCINSSPESHCWEGTKCKKCYCKKTDKLNNLVVLSLSMLKSNGINTKGDVIIPEVINVNGEKKTVIGIGQNVFTENKEITSIQLPSTIKEIDDFAFNECVNLKKINLPEGLEVIGRAAFQLCSNLQEIKLPDSVKKIGDFAFNHCPAIQGTSFKLPASIEKIGRRNDAPTHTFYDFGSNEMAKFELSNENQYYKVEDGILYSKDKSLILSIPNGKVFNDNTFIMPDTVNKLGELSFGRNQNIKTLVLSDNLKIDDELTPNQRECFNNKGNKLNLGIYGYCSVSKYVTKSTNHYYTSNDGILYNKNMTKLVAVPCQYNGTINIPEGVKVWKSDAIWTDYIDYFDGISLNKITEIDIPSTITHIDKSQLEGLNYMHDKYQTILKVNVNNKCYKNENGHIKKI